MYNGTYSAEKGRPTNVVNSIREKMATQVETTYTQPDLGPEPSPEYPSATEHLDNLFKALELLEMESAALFHQIESALAEEGPQCEPVAGPRISNSNLTYRIAHATDLIDFLTYRVNNIRRRVTL